MLSLKGEAEKHAAAFAFHAEVAGGVVREAEPRAVRRQRRRAVGLLCRTVVNCAGLGAQASRVRSRSARRSVPPLHYSKGATSRSPRGRRRAAVYPPPDHASIGLHSRATWRGAAGSDPTRSGWKRSTMTSTPAAPSCSMPRSAATGRPARQLPHPEYAGDRPKIQTPHEPPRDFMIQADAHGVPG